MKDEIEVTYFKRLRGLFKKSIDFSKICDLEIFILVKDKKNKTLAEFNSSPDFNLEAVNSTKKISHRTSSRNSSIPILTC